MSIPSLSTTTSTSSTSASSTVQPDATAEQQLNNSCATVAEHCLTRGRLPLALVPGLPHDLNALITDYFFDSSELDELLYMRSPYKTQIRGFLVRLIDMSLNPASIKLKVLLGDVEFKIPVLKMPVVSDSIFEYLDAEGTEAEQYADLQLLLTPKFLTQMSREDIKYVLNLAAREGRIDMLEKLIHPKVLDYLGYRVEEDQKEVAAGEAASKAAAAEAAGKVAADANGGTTTAEAASKVAAEESNDEERFEHADSDFYLGEALLEAAHAGQLEVIRYMAYHVYSYISYATVMKAAQTAIAHHRFDVLMCLSSSFGNDVNWNFLYSFLLDGKNQGELNALLTFLVDNKKWGMVNQILRHPNLLDKSNTRELHTLLVFLVDNKKWGMVNPILGHPNIDAETRETILLMATKAGHLDTVQRGIEPLFKQELNPTRIITSLLCVAAGDGHMEILKYLRGLLGMKTAKKDADAAVGKALVEALKNKRLEVAKYLLENKPNIPIAAKIAARAQAKKIGYEEILTALA